METAVAASPLLTKYGTAVDPESAHEILTAKMNAAAEAEQAAAEREAEQKQADADAKAREREQREWEKAQRAREKETRSRTTSKRNKSVVEEVLGSRAAQNAVKEVVRGVFGTLFKKR
jgi:Skp family chaperone for outer membrane proteins